MSINVLKEKIKVNLKASKILAFMFTCFLITACSSSTRVVDPKDEFQKSTLSRRPANYIFNVIELRDEGLYQEAFLELEQVMVMYDKSQLNNKEVFTMWMFYASLYQAQKDYSAALGYFNRALELKESLPNEQLNQVLSSIAAIEDYLEQQSD